LLEVLKSVIGIEIAAHTQRADCGAPSTIDILLQTLHGAATAAWITIKIFTHRASAEELKNKQFSSKIHP
jgi:hypothetical protein